jgi:hypothetical protein
MKGAKNAFKQFSEYHANITQIKHKDKLFQDMLKQKATDIYESNRINSLQVIKS